MECRTSVPASADLPGTPDLAFPKARVAVFVDGCFWHSCPVHYVAPKTNQEYWECKRRANVARDRAADSDRRDMGWEPLRVWEHEINDSLEDIVTRIRTRVKQ